MKLPQAATLILALFMIGLTPIHSQAIGPFQPCVELFEPVSKEQVEFHNIREIVGYLIKSELSYTAKKQMWLEAAAEISEREWFINLEVPVVYKNLKATAFMGGEAGGDKKTLLVILENGKVYIAANSGEILAFVYTYKDQGSDLVDIPESKPKEYLSRLIFERLGLLKP